MAMAPQWTARLPRSASEVRLEVKSLQKDKVKRISQGSALATRLSSRSSFQRKRPTVAFSGLALRGNELGAKEPTARKGDRIPAMVSYASRGALKRRACGLEDRKKPEEALKRLQRVKVAMADQEAQGLPWYRFPVNDPGQSQPFPRPSLGSAALWRAAHVANRARALRPRERAHWHDLQPRCASSGMRRI